MRIDRAIVPKSSFLTVEKDSAIIASEILKNERLKKYLVCNKKNTDPLFYSLTDEDEKNLTEHIIKFAPKIKVDNQEFNYLVIRFMGFTPNMQNTEFRNNIIEFDIVCHYDHWNMVIFNKDHLKLRQKLIQCLIKNI